MAALLLAPVVPLLAEDAPVLRVKLEEPTPVNKNRFGLSYRMSFNVTAEFKNVGNVGRNPRGAGRDPGPAEGDSVDRFYDDGYNRVDISGNKDGLTWFWAYKNPSQIVGDTVVMHSSTATPINSKTTDDDPQHGFELTYNRELGVCDNGWRWGVEGAFGWTDVDIHDRRPLAGGVMVIADGFNLGGIDPSHNIGNPPPPYAEDGPELHPGTLEGPGPLIESIPNRTTSRSANGSQITGSRNFDANLWTYRLGPYIDVPIDDKWTFSFSAGAAIGVVEGDFSYRQAVTIGGTSRFQSGSGSSTDVVYGGYLSAMFRYAIDEHWGVFLGGQYLGLTSYDTKADGQKVELDFATTANATMGVSFSF